MANTRSCQFAVLNWHYSKAMPVGKMVRVGLWEADRFKGCALFSRGANKLVSSLFPGPFWMRVFKVWFA